MDASATRAAADQLADQLKKIFHRMASRVTALGLDTEQWDKVEEEILQGWQSVGPVLARMKED